MHCCFFYCFERFSRAQDSINPYNTQLPDNIILQNTDVYYCPYAPPNSTDTRAGLSNESVYLLNSNGVLPGYSLYTPITHDTTLWSMHHCSSWPDTLGPGAPWQRFFTARRQWNGSPSNITVGDSVTASIPYGKVTIDSLEDVDFRASGTIKMKSGFHVKPGAFFHAYIEPKWGDSVFHDDFDSTALDRSKWFVVEGHGDDYGYGAECSTDSNVFDTLDPEATDGHALDVIIREVPDTCSCIPNGYARTDSCHERPLHGIENYMFSSAVLRTCPWPYTARDTILGPPVYANAPYGKYEIREKIPHTMHHTNNWGANQFEYDLNESSEAGNMNILHPNIGLNFWHGPFKGVFGDSSLSDTTKVFRSSGARWCLSNNPTRLWINGFPYDIGFVMTPTDTLVFGNSDTKDMGGFPSSLADSPDSFTFYYQRSPNNIADSETWSIGPDVGGFLRILTAPYHDSSGTLLRFSKAYQPTSVTIRDSITFRGDTVAVTYTCRWDSATGKVRLDNALSSTNLPSHKEAYPYVVNEGVYPVPPIVFNGMDTTGGYQYHTFGMEFLPHELRFMYDSNVVFRVPDRLVPRNSMFYDWASWIPRSPVVIHPAEPDIDMDSYNDSLGVIPGSITYIERQYFENHTANPGFKDVTIGGITYHAAHHLIDYVKVWDLPAYITAPNFPH